MLMKKILISILSGRTKTLFCNVNFKLKDKRESSDIFEI